MIKEKQEKTNDEFRNDKHKTKTNITTEKTQHKKPKRTCRGLISHGISHPISYGNITY